MRLSLRYKAAILIAVTELLLLGILLVSNLRSTETTLEQQLVHRANSTAQMVVSSATEPLLALDLAQLRSLTTGLVRRHNVTYVSIVDHLGHPLAEAGSKLPADQAISSTYPVEVAGSLFGRVEIQISRKQADAALSRTTRYNIAIVAIEIFLVALISLTLGWFLTRDLSTLIRSAEAIEHGDLSARVPVRSHDEIGTLAQRFNHMVERLQYNLEELERSNRRFRDMADNTSDWIWEIDTRGIYTYVSNRIESLLGYAPGQALANSVFSFMQPDDAARLRILFQEAIADERPFYGFEYRARKKEGGEVILESNGVPILDRSGRLIGFRGVTRDITRRREDASRLAYLADRDALTGLYARPKFIELLDDEIRIADRTKMTVSLLVIDMDGFKLINDTHGHLAGDSLLRLTADVLRNRLGDQGQIARLGGDVFGVMLRGQNIDEAGKAARSILDSCQSARATINDIPVPISVCIGACSFPADGDDSQTLLARADVAMSRAKELGHGSYYVFRSTDRDLDQMRRTVNWRGLIRDALKNKRLLLEFQPMVPLVDGNDTRIYEALVRLRDENGAIFSAGQFVDTAEQSGQISDIDRWVMKTVVDLLAEPENRNCCISINLSGRSLGIPGFCEYCENLARQSPVRPDQLIFEITESTAIRELARAESFIAVMKRMGFRFSLDDFGSGFSSFSYLKRLPVDQIKVDGNFIRHITTSREDQIFVAAIVQVARGLGLETVAEYVENMEALQLLAKIGIDKVQGNFIGAPMSSLYEVDINGIHEQAYRRLSGKRSQD
jgi:diguanylate cyclase (GGDEF)-like protein/PAS domain S-box-containing protein